MLILNLSNRPGQAVKVDIGMFYLSALVLVLEPHATMCLS